LAALGIAQASLALLSLAQKLYAAPMIFGCVSANEASFFAFDLHKNSRSHDYELRS
jgi:hypothetical protein